MTCDLETTKLWIKFLEDVGLVLIILIILAWLNGAFDK